MTPTKPLLLSLLLLTLAAPATRADDAEPFEWAGAWTTDGGATRTVDGAGRPGHQRTLEWSSTPPVLLSGAGNDATLALTGRRPGAVGISEKLQGERVGPRADTPFQLVATRAADDERGRHVADVTITAGRESTRERWTRRGPTRLEILSCSVKDGWNPKSCSLTLEYRLLGAPAQLRFRVLVAPQGKRNQGDAERRVADRRQVAYEALSVRDGEELVVHEELLGEVGAGINAVGWDGRDDTDARRLVHGGRLLLVVEATDADARAERPLEVAAPVTKLVAPNWPRRSTANQGRDRAQVHARVADGARKLGFDPLASHQRTATSDELSKALQASAVVFVATHGSTRSVLLYTTEGDERELAEHTQSLADWEIEELPPLQDLHTVVLWACLAGRETVPAALLGRGCDNVVGFSWSIEASGTEAFVEELLTALLAGDRRKPVADQRPLSVGEASRVAAAHATQIIWDHTAPGEKSRRQHERDNRELNAKNKGQPGWKPITECAPYTDCLVTYTAQGASGADTHLEVARWGNSTNTTKFDRVAQEETEFTRSTPKSSK